MKPIQRLTTTASIVVAVVLVAALAVRGGQTSAQDTAASPTPMSGMGMAHNHPAHIHSGTCDALGDVVYPLNNLMAPGMGATPTAGMAATPRATGMGSVVAESSTTVRATLAELTGGRYAINVHESPENIGTYIACGELPGTATGGQLQIALRELNASGYQGQALLVDNGDGTTTVTVQLTLAPTNTTGSPVASPVA